jgi:hypothetical protein
VCYYFIINSKNFSPFSNLGVTKIQNFFSLPNFFQKFLHFFYSPFHPGQFIKSNLSILLFQGTCFSSKAGAKISNDFNKTNYCSFFYFIFLPHSFLLYIIYVWKGAGNRQQTLGSSATARPQDCKTARHHGGERENVRFTICDLRFAIWPQYSSHICL